MEATEDEPGVGRRAAWIGAALAVAVFWLLATGGRPLALFTQGPFTSDFYDVQARALIHGHLDVPADVAGIEGFVVGGKTYLYYGLVPALARVPVVAVTDALDGRLVVLSQLGAVAVASLASARLLRRASAALLVRVPPWVVGAFAFGAGAATPLLWLGSRPLVYHEAELWGAALALVAFDRVVLWWGSRTPVDLAWAGAAATLAASTRGSSGFGPAVALGVLALVLAARRSWRLAAWVAAAAAVPVALYAAVNFARFGQPLSIPFPRQVFTQLSASRQATLAANGGTLFGIKFMPTTVLQYLRPDTIRLQALLPWLTWGSRADVIGGVTFDVVDRAASLPVVAPWLFALSIPGAWTMLRRRVPVSWAACLLGGLVATIPTLALAFVANRYLADFVPPLVVAGALGVAVVAGWLQRRSVGWQRAAVGVLAALAAMAMVVNAALAVQSQRLYLLPDVGDRRAFIGWQYDLYRHVPGGPPPHLFLVDALGPAGRDGDLAVVGSCDGLYRSDGAAWGEVELRPGGAFRARVAGTPAPGPLASGRGWAVDLVEVPGRDERDPRLQAVYRGEDGSTVTGEPFRPSDGEVVLDVVADPGLYIVEVRRGDDDRKLLSAYLVPSEGPITPADAWASGPGSAPLCERLVRWAQGQR